MKISVILPCYNGAKTIAVQLDALAHQTYSGEWELIVVNNGSTDDSVDIVERYCDRLPNLQIAEAYLPPGPRRPVAHSYNTGIRTAIGDAFVFCEADDEVSPNWLETMANALGSHQVVTGPLAYEKLNESWLLVAQDDEWPHSNGLGLHSFFPYPFASGCNLGMQRRVYETVGELDTTYRIAWDVDYCWRVQIAGYAIHFAPDAVLHYRLRHSLKALYRQGYNWGKEDPLLNVRYANKPFDWFTLADTLRRVLGYLPVGLKLFLMSTLNIKRGRGGFALWYRSFAYQLGFINGLFAYNFFPKLLNQKEFHQNRACANKIFCKSRSHT